KSMLALGAFTDRPVVDAAKAFLRKKHERPFVLGVSLLEPHDICYWIVDKLPPGHPSAIPIDVPKEELPPLPSNFPVSPQEPEFISQARQRAYYGEENVATKSWDELHWRH